MATESGEPSFELISTLRYDPGYDSPFYMLSYHRERLLLAAKHFQWTAAISRLQEGVEALEESLRREIAEKELEKAPLRIRLLITRTGQFSTTLTSTPSLSPVQLFPANLALPSSSSASSTLPWSLHLDSSGTQATAHTRFKTTSRNAYTSARSRVNIHSVATPSEVLLYNLDGEITEGSLTSVYVFRGGGWVTPPVHCGGQEGTTRRWALEQELCSEKVVRKDTLVQGEKVWLSNGVRGFIEAILVFGPFVDA